MNSPLTRCSLTCLLLSVSPLPPAVASDPLVTPDGLEVGAMAYRYLYKEPGLMEFRGNKIGARASYSQTDDEGKSGRAELLAHYGRLRYEGSGVMEDVPDYGYDGRLLFGVDFGQRGGPSLAPYSGLGYRYLYNDLRGTTSTGALGYRRESNYFYLPVGVRGRWGNLSGSAEIDFLLRGHQTTYLADTGLGLYNVRNQQHKGVGGRANLLVDIGQVSFGPWISYWRIADSDLAQAGPTVIGLEPKNRTTEAGLEVRLRY